MLSEIRRLERKRTVAPTWGYGADGGPARSGRCLHSAGAGIVISHRPGSREGGNRGAAECGIWPLKQSLNVFQAAGFCPVEFPHLAGEKGNSTYKNRKEQRSP